jgi:hypothetical protein
MSVGTFQEQDWVVRAFIEHMDAVVTRRLCAGKPTCASDVPDVLKLSALMEEVGEVARAIHDGEPVDRLIEELRDVATAAVLWTVALELARG